MFHHHRRRHVVVARASVCLAARVEACGRKGRGGGETGGIERVNRENHAGDDWGFGTGGNGGRRTVARTIDAGNESTRQTKSPSFTQANLPPPPSDITAHLEPRNHARRENPFSEAPKRSGRASEADLHRCYRCDKLSTSSMQKIQNRLQTSKSNTNIAINQHHQHRQQGQHRQNQHD